MWTSNRGHIFRVDGIQCHNIGVCSNVVMQKRSEMLVEKPLIGQTVIAPYMKDANNFVISCHIFVSTASNVIILACVRMW